MYKIMISGLLLFGLSVVLAEDLTGFQQQLSEARSEIDKLQETKEILTAKLKAKEQEIPNARNKLEDLEVEIKQLQQQQGLSE